VACALDLEQWGALLLGGAGVALAAAAIARHAAALRLPVSDPRTGEALVRCFRAVIVGLAVAALGAARLWSLESLAGLALLIGIGEVMETTTVLAALRAGARPYRRYAPRFRLRLEMPAAPGRRA
jgi:hypothetical protein